MLLEVNFAVQQNRFFQIISRTSQVVIKCLSPELTLVRCFFFRGYITVNVSPTLKNRLFFMVMQFFTVWEAYFQQKICINKVCIRGCKNRKSYQKFKKMLESCQETSKLSVDSFMEPYDPMVPQKRDF